MIIMSKWSRWQSKKEKQLNENKKRRKKKHKEKQFNVESQTSQKNETRFK